VSDARVAFVEWASRQAGAPRDPGSLIEGVDVCHDHAGLLATDIEGRRVVWRSVPGGGRTTVSRHSMAIETIDPWSVEPAALRAASDHVAICDACSGQKKVACSACNAGKTVCTACGGQRKMYGYAANGSRRLLNCTTCRGKGELDCAHCRRGIATCPPCAGEGRVQRWIELEVWRRSVATAHPESLVRRFGWSGDARSAVIAADADIAVDVDRPYRLAASDLRDVPVSWLHTLSPQLQSGERVSRQRLRMVRVPVHTVRYRLGGNEDRFAFTGHRFIAMQTATETLFARRAAKLRSLLLLLVVMAGVATMLSLGRGLFYWSIPTFASLAAFAVTLAATYGYAADRTARGGHAPHWLLAGAGSLFLSVMFVLVALPSLGHAHKLITAGKLSRAEAELHALGAEDGVEAARADLHLSRVRAARGIDEARGALARIPRTLPQHAAASAVLDQLILRIARNHARVQRWPTAAETLAQLGNRATAEALQTAAAIFVPLARQRIERGDWNGAATAIADARLFGVAAAELDPLSAAMRTAADDAIASARRQSDVRQRFAVRQRAEAILVAWERSRDVSGTPPLVELRTAMARDLAAVERAQLRRIRR
jgi:hypothetical protein